MVDEMDLLIGDGRNDSGVQELVLVVLSGCCTAVGFVMELLAAAEEVAFLEMGEVE